ncbi:acyl-CoA thioesterase [Oscillochloris sp. ZM17-4]|uniref:acyl-CoA thioesterase n=1 Tax=Oscillochloris sp. ZM17-4 TaxID=2866714 RepID=UPI001C72C55B|nr:thioesterase family protein [Oscillochloris sp. ZM17-4]MBX0328145.1 acyl-CoA thioesterase [Oscillochloris sp. ZM17-4]
MSRDMPAPLAGFPFIHWLDVRFRDLDSLGHVNNAVYATYLESARIDFYSQLTGLPLEQLNIILAELTISYKTPAFFNDRLGVGVRIASFGTKSFSMEYAIARAADEALIASARSVLVMYDYAAGRTVPVPDELRRRAAL